MQNGSNQQYWFDPRGRENDVQWRVQFGYYHYWLDRYLAENEKVAKSREALLVVYKNWEKICPAYVDAVIARDTDLLVTT